MTQRNWSYEPEEDSFNARVGRILANGMDLKVCCVGVALTVRQEQLTHNT